MSYKTDYENALGEIGETVWLQREYQSPWIDTDWGTMSGDAVTSGDAITASIQHVGFSDRLVKEGRLNIGDAICFCQEDAPVYHEGGVRKYIIQSGDNVTTSYEVDTVTPHVIEGNDIGTEVYLKKIV